MSMRRALVAAAAVLVTLQAGSLESQQSQPLFRSGTELVDLYVTVTDGNGRLVPDLLLDDFTIFDDGSPRRSRCSRTACGRSRSS